MSTAKSLRKKILKNPIFLEYAAAEISPHWREFFENCAYGTFLKGVSYKDGVVYCKRTKKKPTTYVLSSNQASAMNGLKQFIKKEVGEISIDDVTKKRISLDVALQENILPCDIKWTSIRAPTTKYQMIAVFVSDMKRELNLTEVEAQNLKCVIINGIASKRILPDDIAIENCKIIAIQGFDWDENGFFLTKPMIADLGVAREQSKLTDHDQVSCFSGWDKKIHSYVEFLNIMAV